MRIIKIDLLLELLLQALQLLLSIWRLTEPFVNRRIFTRRTTCHIEWTHWHLSTWTDTACVHFASLDEK